MHKQRNETHEPTPTPRARDASVAKDALSRYIGAIKTIKTNPRLNATTTVHSTRARPSTAPLFLHRNRTHQPEVQAQLVSAIASHLTLTADSTSSRKLPWACYRRLNRLLEHRCRYYSGGVRPLVDGYALMLLACRSGQEAQAENALMQECTP